MILKAPPFIAYSHPSLASIWKMICQLPTFLSVTKPQNSGGAENQNWKSKSAAEFQGGLSLLI